MIRRLEENVMEDWRTLLSFFPDDWRMLASAMEVSKGLRKDKDIEKYFRTLLLHIGCGYSLRETVVRARLAGLADISDVALLGRLRKAKDWLHAMCLAMFYERGISLDEKSDFNVRLFDATNVKEPGKTGSLWRIHYSVRLPSLHCDFFKITATKGHGSGESFFQYAIKRGDYIIADRGYSTAAGIHHVASKDAHVMVRVNTAALPMLDEKSRKFDLLKNVTSIKKTGDVKSWPVLIPNRAGEIVKGRICAIRKTGAAAKRAQEKILKEASKKQKTTLPATMEYAKYVIVFTTFPEEAFSDFDVLEWYRSRWQVELVFKRFKSIAQMGHLPKHGDDSSQAWLYGKLFVALLTEKLIAHAESISPWGYIMEESPPPKRMA